MRENNKIELIFVLQALIEMFYFSHLLNARSLRNSILNF